jgi:hypothetical protein
MHEVRQGGAAQMDPGRRQALVLSVEGKVIDELVDGSSGFRVAEFIG